MTDESTFKELFDDNDSLGIQHLFQKKLDDFYEFYLNADEIPSDLNEEVSDFITNGKDAIETIAEVANSYDAENTLSSEGVILASFTDKDSVIEFLDWLDSAEYVDSYDVDSFSDQDDSEFDIETYNEDKAIYEVTVYLVNELIETDDDYEDDNINESLFVEGVKRIIKVDFRGRKRIKMKCDKGFRWSSAKNACVKISGSEMAKKKIAMRKALRKKKTMGEGFKKKWVKKMKKAKRFRKLLSVK